jgi:hyperosmotically inducible protein
MKQLVLTGLVALGAVCLPVVTFAADDAAAAGAYVKDSVITTKVKAKLASKHMSTLTKIKVDTDSQGVVWLSGVAPTMA